MSTSQAAMLSMRCYLMNLIGLSFADLTQISACYFDLYLIDIFVCIYIYSTDDAQ